jgi:hypothetical protein
MSDIAQQREAHAARVTTVTSENLAEFNQGRMKGAQQAPVQDEKTADEKKEDPSKTPAEPTGKDEQDNKDHKGDVVARETKPAEEEKADKHGIANRFSKLADQRKAAEQRAEAAEAKLAELERAAKPAGAAKEKPKAANFNDAFEYAEALADWKVEEKWRAREEAQLVELERLRRERVVKTWTAAVKKTASEIADYTDTVASATDLPLTDELRDAILESEIGPRIQYYLIKNPEEVERLTRMTVRGMERAFGKLEAMIEDQMAKVQTKTDEGLPAVKITKRFQEPPEPIATLPGSRNGSAGLIDANGNFTGSFQDYKALRRAGKIA